MPSVQLTQAGDFLETRGRKAAFVDGTTFRSAEKFRTGGDPPGIEDTNEIVMVCKNILMVKRKKEKPYAAP
jgi:hypothetical protein